MRKIRVGFLIGVLCSAGQVVAWAQSGAVADGVRYQAAVPTGGVTRYLGIPFAAPPVGSRRWKPPVPVSAGSGTRSATRFGPSCMQTDRLAVWTRGIATELGTVDRVVDDPFEVNEDCLYLNVWTGGSPRDRRPVMVWIHGGSNLNGSGMSSWYDGSTLAREGVVVVTVNYRLGIFGFMADSALAAESPNGGAGNYGLLDQLEALRWVRRNIAAFGGDPAKVTVFGESAGSIDILHLVASPLSKGLFQRAIAESGAPIGAMPERVAAHRGALAFARLAGVDTVGDRIAALRALPAEALLAAQGKLLGTGFLPGPSVDGWVLPDVTARIYARGEQQKIPLLIGTNALEMSTLRVYLPPFQKTVAGYGAWTKGSFGPSAEKIQALYPVAADSVVDRAALRLVTDFLFTCPTRVAARAMTSAAQPVYLYQFTRVVPGGEKLGAWHGGEISYVFGVRLPWLPQTSTDVALSRAMRSYWARFAATGDPNGSGTPSWPAFGTDQNYLELGDTIAAKRDLAKEACDTIEPTIHMLYQKR